MTFPERDTTKPDNEQGLYNKFNVIRTDGRSAPGEKHENCSYFVLDLDHDQHTQVVCRAYAAACERTHPQLSDDMLNEAKRLPHDLKAVRDMLMRAAQQAAYEYFASCDVGPERLRAADIHDNLHNAWRVY